MSQTPLYQSRPSHPSPSLAPSRSQGLGLPTASSERTKMWSPTRRAPHPAPAWSGPKGAAEEAEPPHKPPWDKVKVRVKGSSDCSLCRLPAYRKELAPAVEEPADVGLSHGTTS